MSTDVPLLNDYKRAFVRNRLLQTFLGGVRLTGCPWYAKLLQLGLLLAPLAVVVPAAAATKDLTDEQEALVHLGAAAGLLAYLVVLQFASRCAHRKERNAELEAGEGGGGEGRQRLHHLVEEEEAAELDGCCGGKTWAHVVPKKRHAINAVLLHPLVAALTVAATLHFLSPSRVGPTFGDSDAKTYSVVVFCWFAVLLAVYSCAVSAPAETATFRALDELETSAMSRPAHVLLLSIPHFVLEFAVAQEDDAFDTWRLISRCSHVTLALMPVLWMLGIFPPLEALVLWLGEQVQVFLLGGSPATTRLRFWLYLLLSGAQFGTLYLIDPEDVGQLFSLASITGYVLSLDLVGFVLRLYQDPCGSVSDEDGDEPSPTRPKTSNNRVHPAAVGSAVKENKKSGNGGGQLIRFSRLFQDFKEFFAHALFFCVNGAVVFFLPYDWCQLDDEIVLVIEENDTENFTETSGNGTISREEDLVLNRPFSTNLLALGWTVVAVYAAMKVTNELQKVYMFFGLVRSPLYCSQSSDKSLPVILWHHLRSLVFNFGLGLLLTYYAKCLIMEDCLLATNPAPRWVELLGIVRVARWAWQCPASCLAEMSAFHILTLALEPMATLDHPVVHFLYVETSRPAQLLVLGVARDRLKQAVEKLYFAVALTTSSLEDRASRRSYAGCLFQTNLLFSPLVLAVIVVSSALSAPVLALFTLPLFFVAFPRPSRFWPGPVGLQANPGHDSAYYQQMVQPLVSSVHGASRAGRLGVLLPGDQLLARLEDRIAWIQVLERGNNYCYYSVKGMELQETSCHSLEATRIDDVFDNAFERRAAFNNFAFHTVTPLARLGVTAYSDSRNVLTGVIESRETLRLIAKTFLMTLPWYLLKQAARGKKEVGKKGRKSRTATGKSKRSDVASFNVGRDEVETLKEESADDDNLDGLSVLPARSDSIDAVELDDWPSTTSDGGSPDKREAGIDVRQWAESVRAAEEGKIKSRRSSAYHRNRTGSSPSVLDSISDIAGFMLDEEEEAGGGVDPVHAISVRGRNKLLPPIVQQHQGGGETSKERHDSVDSLTNKLDNIFLPGGIGERTPQLTNRSLHPPTKMDTLISPSVHRRRRSSGRYSSVLAERMAVKESWLDVPESRQSGRVEAAAREQFSREWFGKTVDRGCRWHLENRRRDGSVEDAELLLREVKEDERLMSSYEKVVFDCFGCVYGGDILAADGDFDSLVDSQGPGLPVRAFGGNLPGSQQVDFIREEAPDLLLKVLLPAFRAAVKLGLDQVLLGAWSSDDELEEELCELDSNWHLGPEDEPSWQRAVLAEKPNLFSVSATDGGGAAAGGGGGNAGGGNINGNNMLSSSNGSVGLRGVAGGVGRTLYRSRLLNLRECPASVARLNPETTRALWASLNLELLYLTNDDDERYSIQAEERLLRNLTVQAADPPLGYAVYSSEPVRRGIEAV